MGRACLRRTAEEDEGMTGQVMYMTQEQWDHFVEDVRALDAVIEVDPKLRQKWLYRFHKKQIKAKRRARKQRRGW